MPDTYDPMLTPARLTAEAVGLQPIGTSWNGTHDLLCALEGRPIRPGELAMPWRPGPNFLNQADTFRSPVVSGYAALLTKKKVMQKLQRVVICRSGAFPISKDAHRTWFFLTPPEPPFVVVIADATLQHLIWRTPINWSRDDIVFRHGNTLRRIRRTKLMQSMNALHSHDGAAFVRLDRDASHPAHGQLRHDIPVDLRNVLADLTSGELVALATLAKRNPDEPVQPDAIRLA